MQVFKRVDLPGRDEEYQLWDEYASEPSGREITDTLQKKLNVTDRANQPEVSKITSGKWW
jgi:predicted lysophospholipase L1 biosynthesis ABC-type transport system permease subunit